MKKLKLKNAKLELLTKNKFRFIGEIKGKVYHWKMNIEDIQRYYDLLQLDKNYLYNIWLENGVFKFIYKGEYDNRYKDFKKGTI